MELIGIELRPIEVFKPTMETKCGLSVKDQFIWVNKNSIISVSPQGVVELSNGTRLFVKDWEFVVGCLQDDPRDGGISDVPEEDLQKIL